MKRFFRAILMGWMIFWRMIVLTLVVGVVKDSLGNLLLIGSFVGSWAGFFFTMFTGKYVETFPILHGFDLCSVDDPYHTVRKKPSTPPGQSFYAENLGTDYSELIIPAWNSKVRRICGSINLNLPEKKDKTFPVRDFKVPPAKDAKEMSHLIKSVLPNIVLPRTANGTPGSGLSESNFGDRAAVGASGEMLVAKYLAYKGVLDNTVSWWSVARPSSRDLTLPENMDLSQARDIDAIVTGVAKNGNPFVYLIDVKNYMGGDCEYFQSDPYHITVLDSESQDIVKVYEPTTNMAMCTELISRALPDVFVSAVVVLAPSVKGTPVINPGVCWPGNVPLMTVDELVSLLSKLSGNVNPAYFRRLLK